MKNATKTPQRLFGLCQNSSPTPEMEVEFQPKDYAEVLATLLDHIGSRNYFNGHLIACHEGFYSKLTTTLVVYHSDRHDPSSPVSDFIPVWWDMETFDGDPGKEHSREITNDFSLATLRQLLHEQQH